MMNYSNKLVFGKNVTQHVVSVEQRDGYAEVFLQRDDGTIKIQQMESKYWLVANKWHGKEWKQLKGNLHYKFGTGFNTQEEFWDARKKLRRESFSIANSIESCLVNKGLTYYKGLAPKDVSILSFDLETTGLKHDDQSMVLLISNTFRHKDKIVRKLFAYDQYRSQDALIHAWCEWVRQIDPSIICGHNIMSFDLPYLKYVADQHGTTLRLGRDESDISFNSYESKFRFDGSRDLHYNGARIYGRELVDTMFLSVKADIGRKYQSYGLKAIMKQEGLEKADRIFYDASQIRHNFRNKVEWEKIKRYCEHDADDSLTLFDLFVPPFFYMAQSVPKSFQGMVESATGSQLNAVMVRAYLQDGHSLPASTESAPFEGALSFGNPGIYSNCVKYDVASLYPSIMIEDQICDQDKDPARYFPQLVQYFTKQRLENKKLAKETGQEHYKHLEQSQKIAINSMYGFLGAPGLLFNSPINAAKITARGREILERSIDWAKEKGYVVANGDTDSLMFCNSNGSHIDDVNRNVLLKELNGLYPSTIRWEDDGYYPRVIVFKAKNYVLYDGVNLKFKGSSLRSASLEPALLAFVNEVVQSIVFDRKDYLEIYGKYIKEANNVTDIKRWAARKTISDKTLKSERTQEERLRDAISESEYVEGDRVYVFFDENDNLILAENFDGTYSKARLLEKLFNASKRFDSVLGKGFFLNYKLKRNHVALTKLLTAPHVRDILDVGL
jgi:DNA polymerase, archaea type